MNISTHHSLSSARPAVNRTSAEAGPQQETPKEYEIKDGFYRAADRYSDSRRTADGITGFAVGAFTGAIDGIVKAPFVAWEIAENVVQAETIGPNLKVLGTIAAIPGGLLSAVGAPFVQAFRDARLVGQAHNEQTGPLAKDASAAYINKKFDTENPSFSSGIMQDLESFGARKLQEGEKPYDVPILSPIFSVVGGVVSGAISGVAGLVGGLAAGLLTTGKEIGGAIFGADQTLGQRAGRIATAPLHTIAIPYGLVKEGLIESVPRGFVDGWNHGPIKPVVDTAKASGKLVAGVLKEAWER